MKKILKGLPGYLELEENLPLIGKDGINYLLMSLPFRCNLRCLKCFSWTTSSRQDMTFATRKKVLREAVELGAKVLVIPGEGEPLLYPGWRELVEFAASLGLVTIMFTNCLLVDESNALFAFNHNVSFIVSLDSFIKATYEKLVARKGCFERVQENVRTLRKIFGADVEQKANCRITRLALNTVVCLPNLDEIKGIKNWCGADVVFVANYPVYEGRAKDNWRELTAMAPGENNPLLVASAREHSETGGPTSARLDRMCAYLYNGLTVDSDGKVLICPDARASRGLIGNVRESSLAELNLKSKLLLSGARVPCIVRAPELYSSLLSSKLAPCGR